MLSLLFIPFLVSCGGNQTHEDNLVTSSGIQVKTTRVIKAGIKNSVDLNGKTIFLKKNTITSPISGYVLKMKVQYGDKVQMNDTLFVIQTKENKALSGTANSGAENGIIAIKASSPGIINEVNISQEGLFVSEGSPLCTLVDNRMMFVQMSVPFQYNNLLEAGKSVQVYLPDETTMVAGISKIMPFVDDVSQTQNVLLKLNTTRILPENLNVRIKLEHTYQKITTLLPKDAVLSNEIQNEFWVMKMINDTLAVKTPLTIGIQNDSLVEVNSSELKEGDVVISEGAYGLPDSVTVKTVK